MKIIYLITVLDGFGAALPLSKIVSAMRHEGHDVDVIAVVIRDRMVLDHLDDAGIGYRILGNRMHQHIVPIYRLARHIRTIKPDLIWTSQIQATVYGQALGKLFGIPVVSWQHNAHLKPFNRRLLRLSRKLTRHWIADSVASATYLQSALGIGSSDIDVWPMYVADPDQPQSRAWDGKGLFRFGSLGRLHVNKNFDVLIEAVAIITDEHPEAAARMSFEIAGTGPQEDALTALATARGTSNVRFVGYRADPLSFLAGLNGYLQPSRNEGLCIAAHEAMNAGLPVIATPVGELANTITAGKNGYLCKTNDPRSLANAIMTVFSSPAEAARAGRTAQDFVGYHFSREKFLENGRKAIAAATSPLR